MLRRRRRRRRQQRQTVISKFTGKQIHSFLTKKKKKKRRDKTATLTAHANSSCYFSACVKVKLKTLQNKRREQKQ